MRHSIAIPAGGTVRLPFRGKFLQIVDTGVEPTVTVALEWSDPQDAENFGTAQDGFTLQSPVEFAGIQISATLATTVDLVVSKIAAAVNAQPRGNAAAAPLFVTGFIETPAGSHTNGAAVVCGPVAVNVLAANANRLEARFTNNGTDPVAIGAAGITWATRTLILNPGDTWNESRGAALSWWAITDAAKTASINVQELFA